MANSLIDTMDDSVPAHLRRVHYPPPPITIADEYHLAILQELQSQSVKTISLLSSLIELVILIEQTNELLRGLLKKPAVKIDAQLLEQLATRNQPETPENESKEETQEESKSKPTKTQVQTKAKK